MAEINIAASGNKPGVRRAKRLSTKVDLTPMVDLGFLLITFFVFSSRLNEPKALKLVTPKDSTDSLNVAQSTVLTVFPLSNGKVFYYSGEFDKALQSQAYGITSYHVGTGIGQVIRDKHAAMERIKKGFSKELFLVIKPLEETNYGQVTEMLDEVLINTLDHYAISDVTPAEKEWIQKMKRSF